MLYLPHFMSWVIVVAIFQQVLGDAGLLNSFLRRHGPAALSTSSATPTLFKPLIVAQVIWKDTGWGTIIFLAALSRDRPGAVRGGRGRRRRPGWRRLWHVTLPGIRPVIVLLLILRLGDVLTVGFEQIILQQQRGRPGGRRGARHLRLQQRHRAAATGAFGAAAGLVKGMVGAVLVLAANKVAHRFGERGVYQMMSPSSVTRRPRSGRAASGQRVVKC